MESGRMSGSSWRHVGQDFSNLSPDEFSARAQVFSAQTALTSFFVLAGVLLMVFAEPPIRWLAGGAPYSGKWMPTIAAVVLIVAYAIILFALPRVRLFFDLVAVPPSIHIGVFLMTVIWVFVQRAVWRARSFERFLDLDNSVAEVEG